MKYTLAAIFCLCVGAMQTMAQTAPATAQREPAAPRDQEGKDDITVRKNAWTVGLISGQLEGLYPRFAAEIQKVLDDKDELRVMPILAYGAASNVDDLLYTKGVDVAFTQSDVLLHFKTQRNIPNIADRIHFIASLYSTEFHVLARAEIKTIQDLKGKNVSFGPPGNSASLTGPIVFERLKIAVKPLLLDHTTGLEKMKTGEIDALVRVIGKPHDYFTKMPTDLGFHFLSISYDDASRRIFDDIYSLGELTNADYPNLIPEGQVVDTVSVPTVLAVYNWQKNTDRFRRVERFTQYFYDRFERFLAPGFHPKWKEVNLTAAVPGWTRFPVAEQMLAKLKEKRPLQGDIRQEFNSFMDLRGMPKDQPGKDALFKEFMSWRDRSPNPKQ
jgi:TRAP transporter TAXI family solute receptor